MALDISNSLERVFHADFLFRTTVLRYDYVPWPNRSLQIEWWRKGSILNLFRIKRVSPRSIFERKLFLIIINVLSCGICSKLDIYADDTFNLVLATTTDMSMKIWKLLLEEAYSPWLTVVRNVLYLLAPPFI